MSKFSSIIRQMLSFSSKLSYAIEHDLSRAFQTIEVTITARNELRVESQETISIAPLVWFLDSRGITVTEARLIRSLLEYVFVRITGIEANAMKREKEKKGRWV